MNAAARLLSEYTALARILEPKDFLALLKASAAHAPDVLRDKTLTKIDVAMSRQIVVQFNSSRLVLPLSEIDGLLQARNDNPTFGNVREIYGRNCYLSHLPLKNPQRIVLDLGANRGMFSLLALVHLGATMVVGVEPVPLYLPVYKLLLEANRCLSQSTPRYTRFISSPSEELRDPQRNVSILTIMKEQGIERFDLAKMDIEGGEKAIFEEPEWLSSVNNLTMELHPHLVGDLSHIPAALNHYGFQYRLLDQAGNNVAIHSAMFLVASSVGAVQ